MSNKVKILLLFMLFIGACEKGYITDCDECMTDEVGFVYLKIYVSDLGGNHGNTVKIYEGPVEDNKLLDEITVIGDYCSYDAVLYKDYTLTVEYLVDGKRYIAIDSSRPKVRHDESTCEEPCYYIYDNIVDLTLKYTK